MCKINAFCFTPLDFLKTALLQYFILFILDI